jgi:staphylococcal nuclease domain-containing protein 1
LQAVLSGDTVVLVGKATSGPPQEITITLASLQAPRISRGPQQSSEDPFAWESREFLRTLCIGKTVSFKIVYCVTSINRTFGDIYFQNTSDEHDAQPVCLSELVVAAGWSTVRGSEVQGPSSGSDKLSSRHDTLLVLEVEAKAAKRGVHGAKGPGRTISWAPTSIEVHTLFIVFYFKRLHYTGFHRFS